MQRDHRLGFPAALLADTPAANTARYPLGRPKRDPEPQFWPFQLVSPAVTFVADSRTMDSDRPQPVVLGVDMGKPGGDETVITLHGNGVLQWYASIEALAEPQADAGWIAHDGKGMPVARTTVVEVRLRSGKQLPPVLASWWHSDNPKESNWVHEPCQSDIMAYRVVPA